MAKVFIDLLKYSFDLNETEINMLKKTLRQLKRVDRRYYYQHLKPREASFRKLLFDHYQTLDPAAQKRWLDTVVQSMLDKKGEPDISDTMVMKIIGQLTVYNNMRVRAEEEGIKLNNLVNFGGMGSVIMLVGIITALILYILAK